MDHLHFLELYLAITWECVVSAWVLGSIWRICSKLTFFKWLLSLMVLFLVI
jgi:hypothetical protein